VLVELEFHRAVLVCRCAGHRNIPACASRTTPIQKVSIL
jgi:hypothetical protein